MTSRLEVGTSAPTFRLEDSEGNKVGLDDFSGQKVVVYFYPAASTPGCSKEACDFRDSLSSLKSAGYSVLGISPDSVEKLKTFAQNDSLNFPLLSDDDHSVALAYGAWGEKQNYGRTYTGIIRSTFVLDEDHKIVKALYNVRATGHVSRLRRELGLDN